MSAPAGPAPRSLLLHVAAMVRLLVFAGLLALGGGFVLFVDALNRPEPPRLRHAEGIVALTGGAERVSDALDLLLAGQGDRLLISGVNPSTSADDLTRTAPGARRLLTCCIELGYAAGNTIGNARETRLWVRRHNIRSLIVVTSDYHMPRALAEIAAAAPDVDLVPYPVTSGRTEGLWWEDGGRLRLALVEYLKYLVVVARTHLGPARPYEESAAALHRAETTGRAPGREDGSSEAHKGSDAAANHVEEDHVGHVFGDADRGREAGGRHGEPADRARLAVRATQIRALLRGLAFEPAASIGRSGRGAGLNGDAGHDARFFQSVMHKVDRLPAAAQRRGDIVRCSGRSGSRSTLVDQPARRTSPAA